MAHSQELIRSANSAILLAKPAQELEQAAASLVRFLIRPTQSSSTTPALPAAPLKDSLKMQCRRPACPVDHRASLVPIHRIQPSVLRALLAPISSILRVLPPVHPVAMLRMVSAKVNEKLQIACHPHCATCSSAEICQSCKPAFELFNSTCSSTCPAGTFANNGTCDSNSWL